jgi:hypothetical protein
MNLEKADNSERISGGLRRFAEPRSALIMGDFANRNLPSTTLASRDALRNTPLPSAKNSLSGTDNRRHRLIRAQSRVGWLGDSRGLAERFEGN